MSSDEVKILLYDGKKYINALCNNSGELLTYTDNTDLILSIDEMKQELKDELAILTGCVDITDNQIRVLDSDKNYTLGYIGNIAPNGYNLLSGSYTIPLNIEKFNKSILYFVDTSGFSNSTLTVELSYDFGLNYNIVDIIYPFDIETNKAIYTLKIDCSGAQFIRLKNLSNHNLTVLISLF